MSPTIYLEEPYRRFRDGTSAQKIVEEILSLYNEHACDLKLDMDFFRDFSLVESRICHKVINYEKNQELLRDVPWFRWHDLAITFYYAMEAEAFGKASVMIHNNHLDMWGQPAEEVYRVAERNMRQRMPDLLLPMQKLLEEMMGIKEEGPEQLLYVLTNRNKIFGASAMLYSEKMKLLADRLRADLLILLSDIDGLYTDDPRTNPGARFVEEVENLDQETMQMGKASTGSSCGTGGMNTKLLAAKIATKSGIDMLIANSKDIKVIHRLVGGMQIGTLFRTSGHDRKFDLPLFVERMHR